MDEISDIFNFFLDHPKYSYSVEELEKYLESDNLDEYLKILQSVDIIRVDKNKRYYLNLKNPGVKMVIANDLVRSYKLATLESNGTKRKEV